MLCLGHRKLPDSVPGYSIALAFMLDLSPAFTHDKMDWVAEVGFTKKRTKFSPLSTTWTRSKTSPWRGGAGRGRSAVSFSASATTKQYGARYAVVMFVRSQSRRHATVNSCSASGNTVVTSSGGT